MTTLAALLNNPDVDGTWRSPCGRATVSYDRRRGDYWRVTIDGDSRTALVHEEVIAWLAAADVRT